VNQARKEFSGFLEVPPVSMFWKIIKDRLQELLRGALVAFFGKQPREVASGTQFKEPGTLIPSCHNSFGQGTTGFVPTIPNRQQAPSQSLKIRKHPDIPVSSRHFDPAQQRFFSRMEIT